MSDNCCNLDFTIDESLNIPMVISGANYNEPYELPTMSTTLKGGAKVGEGLAINEDEQLYIEDGAITAAKLDDGAVTTDKLADGAVTADKIDASVLDLLEGNVKAFDTVADMQSATLEAGDVCHTNGFHTSGDGGAAFYTVSNTGTADGVKVIALDNGLYAHYVSTEHTTVSNDVNGTFTTPILIADKGLQYNGNGPVLYEQANSPGIDGAYQRSTGDYIRAAAKKFCDVTSTAPATALARCIGSWIDKPISYGNDYTLFNDVCNSEIDCSSFVTACIYGITYENSRYVRGTNSNNVIGEYACNIMPDDETRNNQLLTSHMAEYFAENGLLFELSNNPIEAANMLTFGDVLFSSSGTNQDRVRGIDHCVIVLQAFPKSGLVLIAQAGGSPNTVSTIPITALNSDAIKISLVNLSENIQSGKYKYFARPVYNSHDKAIAIPCEIHDYGTVTCDGNTTSTIIGRINFNSYLKTETLYTLRLKGVLPSYNDNGFVVSAESRVRDNVSGTAGAISLVYATNISNDGDLTIPFVVRGTDNPQTVALVIYANAKDNPITTGFRIDEIGLVEGYSNEVPLNKPLSVTITDTNLTDFNNRSYVDCNNDIHLILKFRFYNTLSSGDVVSVGKVDITNDFMLADSFIFETGYLDDNTPIGIKIDGSGNISCKASGSINLCRVNAILRTNTLN